ncbi:MAG: acyl-CoA dehydrogenase family protein, partial [Arenicellales bacterium]|nr:acyl-CoA dehydrogenase family protein [Arenicellales bacterium]
MSAYTPPIDDLRFVLEELADLDSIRVLPGYEDVQSDLVDAILSEAGKVAVQVLAPLNRVGDEVGARLEAGLVVTPPGWQEAFQTFVAGGWSGLMFDPKFGGQGLPRVVSTAVQEMWESSNMSFALWLLLTQAAAEAISIIGTAEQKSVYLSKLVRGEWTGTMNLTEPQAGSDLSAISAIAVPEESGHYLLSGQKMFITYGDHDLAENIIHLVLARTPDAPDGVKGISLFIVPKFIPDSVGEPGLRNEVRCVSLEHKLGIHGSPTALMSYGEDRGAVAYLVGELNRGLE